MKQPLLILRPISMSLMLSLVFVFHSVNSLDNSYDEDSDLGQNEPECGIPYFKPKVDSRIVGGVEATPHSWPWMVSIKFRDQNWTHSCGGSVLNSRWVITAGHCIKPTAFGHDRGPDDLKIVLGEHNRTKEEGTEQEFKVDEIIVHKNYSIFEYDIALIRLRKDVKFNRYIKPICLPDDDDDDVKDDTICVVTGWGDTQSTGDENVLNQVYVPVINNSVCDRMDWNGAFISISDNMICAGYREGGKDACQRDSGGPLVSFSKGKWKLYGLVSSGYECAEPQFPGIYTRVAIFLEWIQEITKQCPFLKKLTAPSGIIKFPMAGEYDNNLHCRWLIVAPPGMVIQLKLLWTDFADLDNCPNCCPDWLSLYDGRNESASSLMTRLCGETSKEATFTTTSSEALVVFVSDENKGDDGFELSYRIIPKHNESKCGIPDFKPKVDSRVAGGVEATPHSWPWQVSIKFRKYNWKNWCGGSVLNSRWVITAAHCVEDGGPADYKIVLGEHNRTKEEGTEQEFNVDEIVFHMNYSFPRNDIALIRLPEDVEFNSFIKPICLPDDDVKDGTPCVATGWGNTISALDENVLNQVYLPVISNKECNRWYWDRPVTDNMLCAGHPDRVKGITRRDSGGPLGCMSEGIWKLVGLSSYSEVFLERPSVFTRVMIYVDWIRENIEQYDN